MIEVTFKKRWGLLASALPTAALLHVILTHIVGKKYYGQEEFFMAIILFLFIMTVIFGFKGKIILSECGIKIEIKIVFLFITVFKSSFSTTWYAINVVDYSSFSVSHNLGFRFDFRHKGCHKSFNIHFLQKNYKEAIRYAVTKLPIYRFSASAQKKLRKMKLID